MSVHLIDSPVYADSWSTGEVRAIFDDVSRTRDWLEILAVLAETESAFGLIPEEASRQIAIVCRSIELDAAFFEEVRSGFQTTGHSLLGLIRALQRRCPGASGEWLCYGATVQDVTDTWLARALRRFWAIVERELDATEFNVARLASDHRLTVMAGRTHGQAGLPITFGFKAAVWAAELGRHRQRLEVLLPKLSVGQLAGGVGSLSAFGARALELRESFCARLGLRAPEISWTTSRDTLADCLNLMALIAASGDKIGHEIYNLQRTEIGEAREGQPAATVGSITMPHKRNPELAEHLGTLARLVRHNSALLAESLVHDHERDGRSWKVEWVVFPESCCVLGKLLAALREITANLEIDAARMRANLDAAGAVVCSEAVMLALADKIGKQSAHQCVYEIASHAAARGQSFRDAVRNNAAVQRHLGAAEIDRLFEYEKQTGQCAAMADRVVRKLRPEARRLKAALAAIPRAGLISEATPLTEVPGLARAAGLRRLWLKRDDLIGFGFGGNKVRGLDLLLADAVRQGADTLVTGAGPQSNHVRATAAAAAYAGLGTVAVLWGAPPSQVEGNYRLTTLLGVEVRFTGSAVRASVDAELESTASELRQAGRRPYVIPRAGACTLGAIGQMIAVAELDEQCGRNGLTPKVIILAAGSGTTLAGWLLGVRALGLEWRVEGVTVSRPASEVQAQALSLARAAADRLGVAARFSYEDFIVHDGFIGQGYGLPSREAAEAIQLAAKTEGVFLDPVYTGKAMAALLALAGQGRYENDQDVVFVHTGGGPALFVSGQHLA
jgi:adenylosuccinate lyase